MTKIITLEETNANQSERLIAAHWGIAKAYQTEEGWLLAALPEDQRPSERMNDYLASRSSEKRALYPKVRAGYLAAVREGRDPTATKGGRGREEFVRVTWDEALNITAKAIRHTYDTYGPSAVWGRSYGWKNTGEVHNPIGLLRRLLMLQGGFVQTFNSYSTAAIGGIQKVIVGMADPAVPPMDEVLANAERIVLWGADPIVTNDIDWTTTLHDTANAFKSIKTRSDIKVTAINPVKPETLGVTGGKWLSVKPGTDAALAMAIVHTLFVKGLANRQFLENYTTGSDHLERYVLGKEDGIIRDALWAAQITGLSTETIQTLARDLATHKTMIMLGWGPQRAKYGESSVWAIWALAAVLGQIGGAGTGIGTHYHYSSGGGAASAFKPFSGIPTNVTPIYPVKHPEKNANPLPVATVADVLLNPGKTIRCGGHTLQYPSIKLVFWAGGNPFAHHPDTGRLREAFRTPDTVIVSDVFETATTQMADIILPASHPTERSDIAGIGTYDARGIVRTQALFEPMGESLNDYELFSRLASALGCEEAFTEGLTADQWAERLFMDAVKQNADVAKRFEVKLPSWTTFNHTGIFLYPSVTKSSPTRLQAFVQDPLKNPLPTETGRLMLTSRRVAEANLSDCPGYPAYLEEMKDNTSFCLISPKSTVRLHSQLDPVTRLVFNKAGCEPVWINPHDANKIGVNTGDQVKLSTKQGSVTANVVVTANVHTGVLVLHHGAWAEVSPDGLREDGIERLHCRHGASNVLIPDEPTSGWTFGNIAATKHVTVTKV